MKQYRPLKSFKTLEAKQQYVRECLLEEGFELLNDYKKNDIKLHVRILSGEFAGYIGSTKWNNFSKGKRLDFRSLLDSEKARLLTDKFTEAGYTVVSIPEYLRVHDKIDLISPGGHAWSVSYDTFRTGVRCPLDSNKSWGERCVGSILKQNNIMYETQKTIFHEDGSKQYMDFYIEYEGGKFNIEYHGRQHYLTDPKNRLFLPVEEQKARDRKKEDYCRNNGIVYIEIPYTINNVKDVATKIKEHIPVIDENQEYTVETLNNDKEIAEHYMSHSEEETAEKFGVAGITVRHIAYRLGYKKYKNYNEEEVLDYYKTHSAQKTGDKFGITKATVHGVARKYNYKKTRG